MTSRTEAPGPLLGDDPRLDALRHCAADERERQIASLIVAVARPVAERVLARFVKSGSVDRPDAEDIVSTVSLRLLTKLRAAASSYDATIRDLDEYIATLTYNALNDHYRRRWPHRARLKNRLRYALTRDPRLALWGEADAMMCGLAQWRGARETIDPPPFGETVLRRMRDRTRVADAVAAFFEAVGGPVPLQVLVETFADLWQIVDSPALEVDEVVAGPQATLEGRQLLQALWNEIVQLRPMQRKALLLNLRDAETSHVLSLFVFTGIADVEAIASAVDMTVADLTAIWNELPLDDLRIASILGVTRQQVINLRKSARERLGRRLSRKRNQ